MASKPKESVHPSKLEGKEREVFRGEATLGAFFGHFLVPTTLGNIVGGVFLVALINFAQTSEDHFPDVEPLSWREWLLGEQHPRARRRARREGR